MVNKQYIISRQYPNSSMTKKNATSSTTTTPLNGFVPGETLNGPKKHDQFVNNNEFKENTFNRNMNEIDKEAICLGAQLGVETRSAQ